MKNVLALMFLGLCSLGYAADRGTHTQEFAGIENFLGKNVLQCTEQKTHDSLQFKVSLIHDKYYAVSISGDMLGASPAVVDTAALGRYLTVTYNHDEGVGILVVDADAETWKNPGSCASGTLQVAWEPSASDLAQAERRVLKCCKVQK